MANLKGSTLSKQSKDAYFRLYALGVSRHDNPDSHLTHSLAVEKKRKMYLKDMVSFSLSSGSKGKLNQNFNDKDFTNKFLMERISNLSRKSSLDYISGISSLFLGLVEANVDIDDNIFDEIEYVRDFVKEMPKDEFRVGRAFLKPKAILGKLFDINFESATVAQLQHETGFRISEAYEFIKNQKKYLINNEIIGVIGKSKHLYEPKIISYDLVKKLSIVRKLPTAHTYSKHLKMVTSNDESIPHDWRLTYVKEQFEKYLLAGMLRDDALKKVSRDVNHHRIEITEYYLHRAS